jgi:phosphatidylinositol phospholipase C delta
MVLEVFGNILYYPQEEHPKELPSPEDLKGRVLLSTKPPKEYLEAKAGGTIKDGDAEANPGKGGTDDDAAWGKEVPDFKTEIQFAKVLLRSSTFSALFFSSSSRFYLLNCINSISRKMMP